MPHDRTEEAARRAIDRAPPVAVSVSPGCGVAVMLVGLSW